MKRDFALSRGFADDGIEGFGGEKLGHEGMEPQRGFSGNEVGAGGTISGARGPAQQGLELVAIPSAQRELGSVSKHDHLIAVEERIQRLDALHVDQGRTDGFGETAPDRAATSGRPASPSRGGFGPPREALT